MSIQKDLADALSFLAEQVARKHGSIDREELLARYTEDDLQFCAFLRRRLPRLSNGVSAMKAAQNRKIEAAIRVTERFPEHPIVFQI